MKNTQYILVNHHVVLPLRQFTYRDLLLIFNELTKVLALSIEGELIFVT